MGPAFRDLATELGPSAELTVSNQRESMRIERHIALIMHITQRRNSDQRCSEINLRQNKVPIESLPPLIEEWKT